MSAHTVLLVCPHLPPRFCGGVEVYCKWLIAALQPVIPNLIVLSISAFNRPIPERRRLTSTADQGVLYYWLEIDANYMACPSAHFFNEAVFDTVDDLIMLHRPSLVHVQGGFRLTPAPLSAARNRGVRTFLTLHDYYFLCPTVNLIESNGQCCTGLVKSSQCAACLTRPSALTQDWLDDWMSDPSAFGISSAELAKLRDSTRHTLANADVILSPSHDLATRYDRSMQDRGGQFRIRIHRLGIPAQFAPARSRICETSGTMPDTGHHGDSPQQALARPLVFAYIGHLHPHKGVHVLVEAVTGLEVDCKNWTLRLYGAWEDSVYHRALRRSINDHPNLTICGPYDADDIANLLADVDIVLLPSLWYENAPLVMLLSLRHGVPVMASRIGGIPEWIHDAMNGWLITPGDTIAWRNAIRHAINNPIEARTRTARCEYSLTSGQEANALISLYESIPDFAIQTDRFKSP